MDPANPFFLYCKNYSGENMVFDNNVITVNDFNEACKEWCEYRGKTCKNTLQRNLRDYCRRNKMKKLAFDSYQFSFSKDLIPIDIINKIDQEELLKERFDVVDRYVDELIQRGHMLNELVEECKKWSREHVTHCAYTRSLGRRINNIERHLLK